MFKKKSLQKNAEILLLLIFAVPTIIPFLNVEFFYSHDSLLHLGRLVLFDNYIEDGCIHPRWIQELAYGHGLPIFNYYPSFVYYLGVLFNFMGISINKSVLLIFILGFFLSGIFMYLFVREVLGKYPALLASVAYIYAPYHLLDAYVRGALPEFFAFVFLPAIFYTIVKSRKILFSFFYAMFIFCHNVSALIATPFIVLFILLQKDRLKLILYMILGLGLCSFYWIPALFEINYIYQIPTFKYNEHFVFVSQLFDYKWGFGKSVPGAGDEMSFQIGVVYLLLFAVLIVFSILKGYRERYFGYFLFVFIFSTFLTTYLSEFIWNFIPFKNFIQFPWRFLFLSAFSLSFLISYLPKFLKEKEKISAFLLCILIILYSSQFIQILPADEEEVSLITNYKYIENLYPTATVGKYEFLPIWVKNLYSKHENIEIKKIGCNKYIYTFYSEKSRKVSLPIFYFPGWHVYINGEKVDAFPDENGFLSFFSIKGYNNTLIIFEDTIFRKLGKAISIFSLLIVLFKYIYNRYSISV